MRNRRSNMEAREFARRIETLTLRDQGRMSAAVTVLLQTLQIYVLKMRDELELIARHFEESTFDVQRPCDLPPLFVQPPELGC